MLPRDACRGERVWAAAGGWQQGTLWATGHAQVGRMWGDVHVGWGAVICTPRPPGDTCLAKPKGISLAHNKAGRRALWDGQSPPSGALSLEKQFPGLWAGQWEQTGHCCGTQCREGGGERPLTASLARPYGPPFCSVFMETGFSPSPAGAVSVYHGARVAVKAPAAPVRAGSASFHHLRSCSVHQSLSPTQV